MSLYYRKVSSVNKNKITNALQKEYINYYSFRSFLMCGFVGLISNNINIKEANFALQKLTHRGPDEENIYYKNDVYLGHKRLVVVDKENGKQPFCYNEFVMIYNGELYNTEELRQDLISKGYTFAGHSDTEVLIKLFAEYGNKCPQKLNGIFAFAVYNTKTKSLFVCRDRFGVKPLYYYFNNNEIMVCSEIKCILSYFKINTININGLQEVLGLGPSHTRGCGIYPNVKEVKGGHYLIFENNKLTDTKYWDLVSKNNTDTFNICVDKVRFLVEDAIKRQLVADVPLCTFLSGGLDSTVITLLARKYKPDLETYSIDYKDNGKFFEKNNFQVSRDSDFVKLLVKEFNIPHHYEIIKNTELIDNLEEALLLKDYPGMVDIDSSLLWFSKQVKQKFTVALSGECSDEIFGGYPWYYKEYPHNGFPWIRNLDERNNLLNDKYKSKLDLINYVNYRYNETLSEVPLHKSESEAEKKHKQMFVLNTHWFMQNLLDRKDRMTMGASLEVRVPFADHRLIEYLYNVPWEYKFHNNMEKGLLREAVKDFVPAEIVNRKKNPYPKTYNPKYLDAMKKILNKCLQKKDSILLELFDKKVLMNLLNNDEDAMKNPWYGQLMSRPQLLAYLYQIDMWFRHYNLNIVE